MIGPRGASSLTGKRFHTTVSNSEVIRVRFR